MELLPSVQVCNVNDTYKVETFLFIHADQGVFLSFQGITYSTNDSNILVTRIGTTNDTSLTCHTDSTTCCRGVHNPGGSGFGEWISPDGTMVAQNSGTTSNRFYWIRFYQVIRLYRYGAIQTPLGTYCCRIPDNTGSTKTICANLIGKGVYM